MRPNYVAVLVAALAYWLLGAVWFASGVRQTVDGARKYYPGAGQRYESHRAVHHLVYFESGYCFCVSTTLRLAKCQHGCAWRGPGYTYMDRISGSGDIHHIHV